MQRLLNLAMRLGTVMFEVGHRKVQEVYSMARLRFQVLQDKKNLFRACFENEPLDSKNGSKLYFIYVSSSGLVLIPNKYFPLDFENAAFDDKVSNYIPKIKAQIVPHLTIKIG